MVSPWSREYAEPADESSPGVDEYEPDTEPTESPSPWRSPANLAVVAALAAAVAFAALVVATLGDSDETSATTPAPSPSVLETLPLADDSVESAMSLRLPVFESVVGEVGAELDDYDLADAIQDAAARPASRARFEIRGVAPTRTVIATRDRMTDLDELIVQFAGVTTSSLIDAGTATTYTTSSTGNWVGRWLAYDEAELPEGGTGDVRSVVDSIVAGPITSGVLTTGTAVADDGLVRLDDGTTARRYRVDIGVDASEPPAWLRFALDSSLIDSDAIPPSLSFDVYVTSRPSLAMVTSRIEVDGDPIVFVQRFEQASADQRLSLPPDWAVIEVT